MPTYIVLVNLTDQGVRTIKEGPKRFDAFLELCEKVDARAKDIYATMGRYDAVALVDAPNDGAMNTILYTLGSRGNVRTETMRAFTRQELEQAVAKIV